MALPDFRINPYVQPYQGGLSQEFAQSLGQRIQDYDINREQSDVLSYQNDALMNMTAPFEGDRAFASAVMDETRGEIDAMAQKGDYENLGRAVRQSARNFNTKIQPLVANQQRYAGYMAALDEQFKKGEIGIDTLNKAKHFSMSNYKGLDRANPETTMFSGFTPSKDINVTDKVDKLIAGWKANGHTILTMGTDGSYIEKSIEEADENEIAQAAFDYLEGDSEFGSYRQTQYTIGNSGRLNSEVNNAVMAAANKYGYRKTDAQLKWMPEYAYDELKTNKLLEGLRSESTPSAWNLGAFDKYDAAGYEQDPTTGKMVPKGAVRVGDKLLVYKDPNGKPITKEEYNKATGTTGAITDEFAQNPYLALKRSKEGLKALEMGYKIETIPADQVDPVAASLNESMTNWAAEQWFREEIAAAAKAVEDNPKDAKAIAKLQNLRDIHADSDKTVDYLKLSEHKYNNPEYLNKAGKLYRSAIENSAAQVDIRTFPVGTIPGAASAEITGIKDDDALVSAQGKPVTILSTDPEFKDFIKDRERVDLNALLEIVQQKYGADKVKGVRRIGPMSKNPASAEDPAIRYSLIIQGDQGERIIDFAATVDARNNRDIATLNRVMSLASVGENATVNFFAPNSKLLNKPIEGHIRVKSGTVKDKNGNDVFGNYMEILDVNKKKIQNTTGNPYFRQDIPASEFPDYYKDVIEPNMLDRWAKPKK